MPVGRAPRLARQGRRSPARGRARTRSRGAASGRPRECLDACRRLVAPSHEIEHRVDPSGRRSVEARPDAELLASGGLVEECRGLDLGTDPWKERGVAWPRPLTEDGDLATIRPAQALDDLERRRLTGAVWPENAEDLTGLNVERNAVNCGQLAVSLRYVSHGDRNHRAGAYRHDCQGPLAHTAGGRTGQFRRCYEGNCCGERKRVES